MPLTVIPNTHERDQDGFWEAARRHELVVRVCQPGGHVLHLPRDYCSECDSWDVVWKPVEGRGTLHTWTTVEHTVDASFPAPYTIVLVELDDPPGVRFVGSVPGRPELEPGLAMRVVFVDLDDGVSLPQWVPAAEGAG